MKFSRSWVEIDLGNFEYNLTQLKSKISSGTSFMQIVKADAYGHGAYEIALKSLESGASYLGVANSEEGILLRTQNISAPILILSPSSAEEIDAIIEYSLVPTISSLDFATKLNEASENQQIVTNIQIEFDTGMGRSGFRYESAKGILSEIVKLGNLNIEGIYSHFCASESDLEYTQLQNKRFLGIVNNLSFKPRFIHIANSPGVITCSPPYTNMVRLGLLSYGVYPNQEFSQEINLKPVMSFKSFVCQIKTAQKGDSVGYNRTYIAPTDIKYAIIPVGYADGYDFLLSNKGIVRIKNRLFPVIGRISMDMITVDITSANDIHTGDEVILLNGGELRSERLVQNYNGLSYELLSQVGRRARRYYYEHGKLISESPLSRRDFVSSDFGDDKLNLIIESAIGQRLQSKEIASLLYGEILRRFFIDKDRNIHYRENFQHTIVFRQTRENNLKDYFQVETNLTFTKVLQQDYFYVVCANKIEHLEKYFRRRDVEYRWLLDDNFSLREDFFKITAVSVNGIPLGFSSELKDDSLQILCSHGDLSNFVGQEVDFSISTATYYPKKSHQLAIYITEITKAVTVRFRYPVDELDNIETITVFSGQSKYPAVKRSVQPDNSGSVEEILVSSSENEWVFPNSGIIFAYSSKNRPQD